MVTSGAPTAPPQRHHQQQQRHPEQPRDDADGLLAALLGLLGGHSDLLGSLETFLDRTILLSVPELDEPELVAWYSDVDNQNRLVLALSLTSVATVAFLWFIAVIRRRLGDREDQFFSTVFFGSGLVLNVARLLATSAAVSPAVGSRLLDSSSLNATVIAVADGLGAAVALVVAPRMQAVFVITTSTVILRSRALPTWLAYVGYVFGVVMFFVPFIIEPMDVLFPLWMLLVSLTLFFTVRSHGGDEIDAFETV